MDEVVVHERRRGKKWYSSKTLWLNLITAALAIIMLASTSPSLEQYSEAFLFISGVLNIILRVFFTNQPVK